jgi:outer membrane protein
MTPIERPHCGDNASQTFQERGMKSWIKGWGMSAALCAGGLAQAVDLPRWEAGLGVMQASIPDYRGSDERRVFTVPAPYLVYRGDTVKADREGTRAQILGNEHMHLDIYLGGSLPVSSDRNQARNGMPGLRGNLDIGPALDIRLWESDDERTRYKLRIPVSYGFTLGRPREGLGWQTAPTFNIYSRDVLGFSGWGISFQTGPIFATRQRNAHYYDVAEAYATADRPAYQSAGGYAGWQTSGALMKRFDRIWVGAFARADNLSHAAFIDSPLVRSHQYVMGGLAVIWVLGESSERVKVD